MRHLITLFLLSASWIINHAQTVNLYSVVNNDKFGYMDNTGKLVIPCQFSYAQDFTKHGLAAVQSDNGKFGLIDEKGSKVLDFEFERIDFHAGCDLVFAATAGATYEEMYDFKGNQVKVPFAAHYDAYAYKQLNAISGKVLVLVNYKFGVANLDGSVFLPAVYDWLRITEKGIFGGKDGRNFFMDHQGVEVFTTTNDCFAFRTDNESIKFRDKATRNYGFMDYTGKVIVPADFKDLSIYREGMVAFCDLTTGKWGFLDEKGTIAISPKFYKTGDFYNGLAWASEAYDGLYGLIDKSGNWVVPPKYRNKIDMKSTKAIGFFENGKKVEVELIDNKGKRIKLLPNVEWDYPLENYDENGICRCHLILPSGQLCEALMDLNGKVLWKSNPFNYCFPANALVSIPNGNKIEISNVKKGDVVIAYDAVSGVYTETKVLEIEKHYGSFVLNEITTDSYDNLSVSVKQDVQGSSKKWSLQCTPNHPILTSAGVISASELVRGMTLFALDEHNKINPVMVSDVQLIDKTDVIYNLKTEIGNYFVNGIAVKVK
jgi:hypothetical protein